jgi:hypothetical protein
VVWLMNGATVTSGALVGTVADTTWRVDAVGDFNGDDKVDLMWRRTTTGDTVAWLLNSLTLQQAAYVTRVASVNWQIVAPR